MIARVPVLPAAIFGLPEWAERLVLAGIVLVVTVMILPLPSSLLDLLIVANISVAVLILLVSTNVKRTLEFSSFPSLLLVVTLVRIGLNVSTSRAVLSTGEAPLPGGDTVADDWARKAAVCRSNRVLRNSPFSPLSIPIASRPAPIRLTRESAMPARRLRSSPVCLG